MSPCFKHHSQCVCIYSCLIWLCDCVIVLIARGFLTNTLPLCLQVSHPPIQHAAESPEPHHRVGLLSSTKWSDRVHGWWEVTSEGCNTKNINRRPSSCTRLCWEWTFCWHHIGLRVVSSECCLGCCRCVARRVLHSISWSVLTLGLCILFFQVHAEAKHWTFYVSWPSGCISSAVVSSQPP